ncbi:nucleoside hydrolase [Aristaeella hokkaidonensis]|uniref:Nucleoside hydrolase n=1 Tax=Aristaeella hokkaidonensis TaxID=3046382 RepID=A0AC61NCN4_9FIRM|nr:nucleoside hydrolase [Aristaeella hokkaidonensis]QUC68426.1 nucleoside hydrolase [Aristaeella hokkaidonensis]SNT95119.1 Inosine-uridine nucleoside N-ribohydrolase [Aristaeella hokkaidonensis]
MIRIPDEKKIRVIIDTDAACEADDPFAIVQALLSPKLIVKGILAEHFNEKGSVQKSYDEIMTILDAMDLKVPVFMGEEDPVDVVGWPESVSEAADFIISEAMKDDPKPLYILCQGAITNLAAALHRKPAIKDRIRIIWIGTHGVSDKPAPFREFNAGNDVTAANYVLESGADVWLVPSDVYTTITVGLAELKLKVLPCGRIGKHLYENMIDYNLSPRAGWTQGESWSLGDSPAIAIALNPECGKYVYTQAPHVGEDTSSSSRPGNPVIRVYKSVDSRYILEDFFAKLQLFTAGKAE